MQHGQQPRITPLPSSDEDTDIEMRDPSDVEISSAELRSAVAAKTAAERQHEHRITVAETPEEGGGPNFA